MIRLLLCGTLILGLVGCGPRAQVAKDKILAQIDKILGELEVKRKDIEIKRKKLASDMEDLRKSRIKTEVRLEQLDKRKVAVTDKMGQLKKDAEKLKELQAELMDGKLERNGKTYTEEDLKKLADRLANTAKMVKNEQEAIVTSHTALTDASEFLKTQESTANDLMAKLELKIQEIDSKKVAMDAVKQASLASGDQKSMSDRFAKLNTEIDDMFVDVESAMRLEGEKLKELQAATSTTDELLTDTKTLDDSMADLDAILSGQ